VGKTINTVLVVWIFDMYIN